VPSASDTPSFQDDDVIGRGHHQTVRTAVYGVVLIMVVFIVANTTVRPAAYGAAEIVLDAVTLCLGMGLGLAVRRRRSWVAQEVAGLGVVLLTHVNILGTVAAQGSVDSLSYLPFVVIAAGAVFLTWSAYGLVSTASLFAGTAAAAGAGTGADVVNTLIAQLVAAIVGGMLLGSRLAQGREMAALRRAEAAHQAQRVELQERVAQSQRLEALGTLAGGVAHDVNNALAAIGSTAEGLLRSEAPARGAEGLRGILAAVDQAASLTRNLLAFARRSRVHAERTHPGQVAEEAVGLLRRTLPKGVEIELVVASDLEDVLGDAGQLANALLNLGVNASDAMGGRGHLLFEARMEALGEADGTLAAGRYVTLSVSDDGPGMDAATAARVFEPFFSTKEGEHSGLGLSMVFGTLRQHGGDVRIHTAPGEGTVVRLWLPALSRVEDVSEAVRASPTLDGIRVLVVDDEPLVRRGLGRLLRSFGAEARLVGRAADAVPLYRADPFDVVLLDVAMPEMSGPEVLRALREADPQVSAVFLSGYPKGTDGEALPSASGFLTKPCRGEDLRDALAAAVRSRHGSSMARVGRSESRP
jgi:signal transduction histidine kinase/ActR/RegA family two-component response regulator